MAWHAFVIQTWHSHCLRSSNNALTLCNVVEFKDVKGTTPGDAVVSVRKANPVNLGLNPEKAVFHIHISSSDPCQIAVVISHLWGWDDKSIRKCAFCKPNNFRSLSSLNVKIRWYIIHSISFRHLYAIVILLSLSLLTGVFHSRPVLHYQVL